MIKTCEICAGTGFLVGYANSFSSDSTAGQTVSGYPRIECKKCNGEGKYNEDREVTVPIKFVNEEYWKNENY